MTRLVPNVGSSLSLVSKASSDADLLRASILTTSSMFEHEEIAENTETLALVLDAPEQALMDFHSKLKSHLSPSYKQCDAVPKGTSDCMQYNQSLPSWIRQMLRMFYDWAPIDSSTNPTKASWRRASPPSSTISSTRPAPSRSLPNPFTPAPMTS